MTTTLNRPDGWHGRNPDGGPRMQCPSCRATITDGQRFCGACGAALATPCPACGVANPAKARYCAQCGAGLAASILTGPPKPEPFTSAPGSDLPSAEHRQLSILFCDLVESTALSGRLDAEDLRAVLGAYHRCCAETISRAGGYVAKYMGDGVLAYFGYPRAHENNAEQSVRAALALVEAVGKLRPPVGRDFQPLGDGAASDGLQVRVGIATGRVVVGDLIGEGIAQERMVVGQTPNLAARLKELANPGEVVISDATRKLLGGLFEYRDLGATLLKGFTGPVPAFQVLWPSQFQSRFDARHEGGLAPLCDRTQELALLLDLWNQSKAGSGHAVLITGEPGIGKSRLVAALLQATASTPHFCLRCYGSQHYEHSAFHPILANFQHRAGFAHKDTPEEKLAKLEALLGRSDATEEEIALAADLLSLPYPGCARLAGLNPQRRHEKTLEAFMRPIERLTAQRPVLIVWEDVHWVDPSSLEVIKLRIERIARQRVMVVLTARPGFAAPWLERGDVTLMPLTRLGSNDAASLIGSVTEGKPLPDDLLAQIVARSDGVPLFIEELTKSILESGLLRDEGGRYVATAPDARAAIPATLHDSLTARLDRLAPWRDVVQIGAALGREFAFDLLRAIADLPDPRLRKALDQLVRSELVFCRGAPPDAVYVFKHALVQDTASQMMLRGERQQLHARIVAVLESQFAEIVLTQPERVGQHCVEAALFDKAIRYWLTASRHALARSTTQEAVALLRKGLGLLPQVADEARREQLELDLQIALGQALGAAEGYAATEADEAYSRARELCSRIGRPRQLVPVFYGQFLLHIHRLDMAWVRKHGEEACRLGDANDDPVLQWLGGRMCGSLLSQTGEFAAARPHLERSVMLSEFVDQESAGTLPPEGPKVGVLFHLCRVLCCLGYLDQARQRLNELMIEARARPTFALFLGLSGACILDWCVRSVAGECLERADELLSISIEQGLAQGRAWANLFRGRAIAVMGSPSEAIPLLTSGLANYRALGIVVGLPMFLTSLAEAYGLAGQPEAGLERLAEAEQVARTTESQWPLAETLRLRGSLLRDGEDFAAAEESFLASLDLARQQEARLWELRTATSLADLWRARGRGDEARELLAPIVAWFSEGADLKVVRQARELLSGEPAAR